MPVLVNGNEIVLIGTVGDLLWFEDSFTAADVILALAQVGNANPVTIRVNSGGGVATEGSAIHSAIARHSGRKTVIVEGIAASAASVIAMAGDEVVMALGALMMVHDPSGLTFGTVKDHEQQIVSLNALGDAMSTIYAKKTGHTAAECRADMEAEIWMTADEAVAKGYADRIEGVAVNDNEPTAFNYRLYRNAPAQMVALTDARAWAKRDHKAATSAAHPPKEKPMSSKDAADNQTAQTDPPTTASNVVSIDDARSQGRNEALAYVREVNEICALAGASDRASEFIEKDVPVAQVRKSLLEARASADAAATISNRNSPPSASTQKPAAKVDLVADMKRRHSVTA